MRWLSELDTDREPSEAERNGSRLAERNPSAMKAAFHVALRAPREHIQYEDLRHVEDFLHGYYGRMLFDLQEKYKRLSDAYDTVNTISAHQQEKIELLTKNKKAKKCAS